MPIDIIGEQLFTFEMRPATPADIETLIGFTLNEAREAEQRELPRADAERGVAAAFGDTPRARYWVVETGGAVVASVSVVTEWSNFRGGDYWWIQSLYIVPEHRGSGMVDMMLLQLARIAREGGALDLRLLAATSNARALRAYRRLGFTDAPYVVLTRPIGPA